MLSGVLGKALAFAGLTALVWMALALQMAAQATCGGSTVALVKPFGAAIVAQTHRSRS